MYLHQNEVGIISDKYTHSDLLHIKENGLSTYTGGSLYSKEELRLFLILDWVDVVQLLINAVNMYLYEIASKNNLKNNNDNDWLCKWQLHNTIDHKS